MAEVVEPIPLWTAVGANEEGVMIAAHPVVANRDEVEAWLELWATVPGGDQYGMRLAKVTFEEFDPT